MNIYYRLKHREKEFSVNNFEDIPDNVYEINCSNNKLTSLPDWKNLQNLQIINCSHNDLTSLPNWNLENLRIIICTYNKLVTLPDWNNLQKLIGIDCSYNNIIHLPSYNYTNLYYNTNPRDCYLQLFIKDDEFTIYCYGNRNYIHHE
jgi:Leucine-rich repeat (LRR) protein